MIESTTESLQGQPENHVVHAARHIGFGLSAPYRIFEIGGMDSWARIAKVSRRRLTCALCGLTGFRAESAGQLARHRRDEEGKRGLDGSDSLRSESHPLGKPATFARRTVSERRLASQRIARPDP